MAYFDSLTTAQVSSLTTADINALTSSDLSSLTTAQIVVLSTAQIAALSTANISGITTQAIVALNTAQIPGLETADIPFMTAGQVQAFETRDLAAFSTAQLSALGPNQLSGLTTSQLSNLSTTQVAALNTVFLPNYGGENSAVQPFATGNAPSFIVTPPNPMDSVIPTGTTWSSGLIPMNGFNSVVVGVKATQVLTVTVQRYLDSSGTLAVGAAGTLTSTANVAGYTSALSANVPAMFFKVTAQNASGSTAVINNFAIAVQTN